VVRCSMLTQEIGREHMNQFSTWLMTAVFVASAGGWAMAQQTSPMFLGRPLPPPDRLAAVLGLTDEQKAAWATSREDLQTTARPLLKQVWALRPDPSVVGQKVIALHELRTQLRDARETADNEFATLLTPEQRVKFEAFKAALPEGVVMHGVPPGPMDVR